MNSYSNKQSEANSNGRTNVYSVRETKLNFKYQYDRNGSKKKKIRILNIVLDGIL